MRMSSRVSGIAVVRRLAPLELVDELGDHVDLFVAATGCCPRARRGRTRFRPRHLDVRRAPALRDGDDSARLPVPVVKAAFVDRARDELGQARVHAVRRPAERCPCRRGWWLPVEQIVERGHAALAGVRALELAGRAASGRRAGPCSSRMAPCRRGWRARPGRLRRRRDSRTRPAASGLLKAQAVPPTSCGARRRRLDLSSSRDGAA